MTYVFNMHEAKSKLSRLVELAESGESVRIARNGQAVVELKVIEKKNRPLFGEFRPLNVWTSEDFDEPVQEWIDAFALSQTELELPGYKN